MPLEDWRRGHAANNLDYPAKDDGTTYWSFLSYSTRDDEVRVIKPFVDRYLDGIRDRIKYIPVYYDYFYMPGGHWDLCKALGRAISESDFTTAFLSPGYDSSPWCGFEWGYTHALNQRDREQRAQAPHPILAIVWKRPIGNFGPHGWDPAYWSIDIAEEFASGDVDGALDTAFMATARFLRDLRFPPYPL